MSMTGQITDIIMFLKEKFPDGIQMFSTRNNVWDVVRPIYDYNGVRISFCSAHGYIEIFGLNKYEFEFINMVINKKDQIK